MSDLLEGSCLCGGVTYQVRGVFKVFQYCHCSRCQKFTGSAHAANAIIPAENFKWILGEGNVGCYKVESAKYFATSFCKNCGSSLPWAEQSGKNVIIPMGTLDSELEQRPTQNLFWESRACWYESVDELPKYDGFPKK